MRWKVMMFALASGMPSASQAVAVVHAREARGSHAEGCE